jgi:hypothetical protein
LSSAEAIALTSSKVKRSPQQVKRGNLQIHYPLNDVADGTSADGSTFVDRSGVGNNGTGDDGANNTGLTAYGEAHLSYPE